MNKKKDKLLQECDMIELLDGSEAFGKAMPGINLCTRPVAWVLLGTQLKVYLQQMGGDSNGRLRFVMVSMDK